MAKMIQLPYDYSITVPIGTAQSVQANDETPISLEALGLLVNLLSYPTTWELHKTELYKRFSKNGRTSVNTAWNDLMTANYIIEYKYRVGKKYEYVYYFRKVPFTSEEKAEILENARSEHGEIWGLDFQQSKMESPKPADNQKTLLNKKTILNSKELDIDNIDDDKRTSSAPDDSQINLLISNFREATKDDLSERSFKSVVRKVVDKYSQGKVNSFRDYLVTALIRKIDELDLRRQKDNAKQQTQADKKQRIESELKDLELRDVPFYNWLDD
jgi:hypothetical protein